MEGLIPRFKLDLPACQVGRADKRSSHRSGERGTVLIVVLAFLAAAGFLTFTARAALDQQIRELNIIKVRGLRDVLERTFSAEIDCNRSKSYGWCPANSYIYRTDGKLYSSSGQNLEIGPFKIKLVCDGTLLVAKVATSHLKDLSINICR